MKAFNNRIVRMTGVLGLVALFGGIVALTPAKADDDWRFHRERVHVYIDIVDVHRDEVLLIDLTHRRDECRLHHEFDRVRLLDRQIDSLRWHIDHDRRDLHRDIEKSRYDRDHDRDRDRDRDHDRNHDRDRDHDRYRDHDGR